MLRVIIRWPRKRCTDTANNDTDSGMQSSAEWVRRTTRMAELPFAKMGCESRVGIRKNGNKNGQKR
eukprot:2142579-Pyramimonas_sp.AAC.1